MRINRRSLDRVIKNTILERTVSDRSIIAIYLGGSLLEDEYSLGGTVDLDLFFVHAGIIEQEREIVRLTDEVHLDIAHHDQGDYRDTRNLRVHPWMGPTIINCEIYHDLGHFMDFIQASVRGQFDQPEYVIQRARTQADNARQMWFKYEHTQPEVGPSEICDYLYAIWNAGNAIASLSGGPLTERRYLLKLPQRTEVMGRPELFAGFMGLLGAANINFDDIREWLPKWEAAYNTLDEHNAPARLHPVRKQYYLKAFEAILAGDQPGAVLWPLLNTWTHIISKLPVDSGQTIEWCKVFQELDFLEGGFKAKIESLDDYLDQVEELIDDWSRSQGIY
jgi:hypothetical protein